MNPVLALAWRGNLVESQHRGTFIIQHVSGDIVATAGDINAPVYPRSSLKLIQALPLLESGAADKLQLKDEQIAFTCASHNGEALHVRLAKELLARVRLDTSALACGAAYPSYPEAAHTLIRHNQLPGREHHNCSGKHSGMLALCHHMQWETDGYHHYDHPSQQTWRQVLAELSLLETDRLPWDLDGCGIPTLAFPLTHLVRAYLPFTAKPNSSSKRSQAMQRILQAIAAYPMSIAGTERACTLVAQHSKGRVIVKAGAEGVFIGLIPDRQLAFALKVDDGSTRGAETALGGVLSLLNEPVAQHPEVSAVLQMPLLNSRQEKTGQMQANPALFPAPHTQAPGTV